MGLNIDVYENGLRLGQFEGRITQTPFDKFNLIFGQRLPDMHNSSTVHINILITSLNLSNITLRGPESHTVAASRH